EVTALYEADVLGTDLSLDNLQIQYADYAAWQRDWLQGDVLEGQLSYWRAQLGGELPALQLPTDRPRPPVQTYNGATESVALSKQMQEALHELSRRHGATLFMTLLGAFQTLLYRYSGQEDFAVGTPIAGRVHEETEDLIGFFVNTLVMRTDLSNDPTFVDLLSRVKETALGAFANQDVPFEKLVEELQPERDTSRTPLFQAMFVLQNTPTNAAQLPGLTVEPFEVDNQSAKFDLTLTLEETTAGLSGTFEYNTDLFDAATIQRMTQHFENLLTAMTADPMQKVAEVPLLSSTEEQVLLVDWNQTDADFPRTMTMYDLFEAQVERTPEAIALVVGEQRLTYRELNARANQVAYYLRRLGVQQESLVGVYLQRSVEMVVGMLGILKAGGAYVPLDPAYPQERILYTMEDAEATVLLTQSDLQEQLPSSLKTVCLDSEWEQIAQEADGNLTAESLNTSATHLAYVIYTSGSTGRPKGVAIEHQSAVAMIAWAQGEYSQQDLEGVLFSTSICFDLSVYELFVTLSSGGKLILAENALHLPQLPAKDEVTLINTVPSAIAELLRIGGLPTTVRTVNLAGEPLHRVLVEKLYQLPHIEKVYNLYGPSEDTTYSTYTLVEKSNTTAPTIGRPIANTQLYVLDRLLQPVPLGVVGELFIAGSGLARGYLNRAEMTDERFLPNPFGAGRMYRTGDLVRYLPDGELEYIGRADHQVKVRGYRIELGEIEERLTLLPTVSAAVVLVREDEPGDKRLAAYVVSESTVSELRSALKETLPEYMIPSNFVKLDALPLTPNGKVDRKA
ncbi:non-ribosomal peptide synthetase, partial [Tumebacillus permanentifrigoris]|uniref:non-ribosomal peptide synthetase n=1 Tax=Tumebacillus permanentifrigoris TaxID=378543 RepID=UPI0011B23065